MINAILQACVPTGGGTSTTDTFNVNIKSGYYANFGITMLPSERKLLVIDGEQLDFYTEYSVGWSPYATFTITTPTNASSYEYLSDTIVRFPCWEQMCVALPIGQYISSSLDTNFAWIPCNTTNNTIIGFKCSSIMTTEVYPTNIRIIDEDRYFVFRKRDSSNIYTYFWIRVKLTSDALFHVYNGKFQRNSIVTGQ